MFGPRRGECQARTSQGFPADVNIPVPLSVLMPMTAPICAFRLVSRCVIMETQ